MSTKPLKSVGSEDIDDFSSVYTDDFETESPISSPDNRYKEERQIRISKTTESEGSSFSGHQKHYINTRSKSHRGHTSKLKPGCKAKAQRNGKKNVSPVKNDVVQTRMLSAQRSRINTLNNELGELHNKLEELVKENKLLKKLQFRQEKSLRKFENKDSDVPRLIAQYEEDQKLLKAKLRKSQESERALESKLRESNEEIQRVQHSVQKLRKLVDNKNLGERSDLTKQLNTSQDRLYDCEKKNSELEKKLELSTQSFTRQMHSEKAKHTETKEKLKTLEEKFEDLENRLKEKDRALQVSNIYSLRARQNLEKAAVNLKTNQSGSRKSAKSSAHDNKSKPFGEPTSQLTSTKQKPLSAGSTISTQDFSFHSSSSGGSIGSPKPISSPSEHSSHSAEELLTDLNRLNLHNGNTKTNEKGHRKDSLSFLNAEKPANSSVVSELEPTSAPNSQGSGVVRTPLLREKSFTVASNSSARKEERKDPKNEEEKKKAALIARMKAVDESCDVASATQNGADLLNLLDGPPTQKPVLHHKKSTDGLTVSLGKDQNSQDIEIESEVSFGGYAPTVTSAPKRRLQSRIPSASDSDKPLLDLKSGKSKNNDLLQQLFGNDTSKPLSNNHNKKNSFFSAKTSLPKASPLVASELNGSGDLPNQLRKNDVSGSPMIKAVSSPPEDDIEELTL